MGISMNSCELVTFITATSCGIAKCFPKEDLPLLIAVLSEIAATLATILEQEERNHPEPEATIVHPV
jgi:hypothetical protein